jgi:hypothetical protein
MSWWLVETVVCPVKPAAKVEQKQVVGAAS